MSIANRLKRDIHLEAYLCDIGIGEAMHYLSIMVSLITHHFTTHRNELQVVANTCYIPRWISKIPENRFG